jgi:FkbM family methyltransferase
MMLLALICAVLANLTDGNSHHLRSCQYPAKCEKTFNLIMASLFQEKQIPPGDVLDVGAHNGGWSCMYACLDPDRTVHPVDPSPKLIHKMRCPHPNFKPHNAAISNRSGFMHFNAGDADFVGTIGHHAEAQPGDIPIQTLDYLFLELWQSTPGFLHIDVEGFELQVLQGANKVINKYQPVFSIEIHVVENKEFTVELIKYAENFGYHIYMVNEVCGMRVDCRNFICFPPVMQHMEPGGMHPLLDLSHRTNTLVKVSHKDVFDVFEKVKPALLGWFDARAFNLGT